MRVLRSVTLQPIGMFSRTLKVAIALRALVITGFWPAISARSAAATAAFLESAVDFADAHVDDDLVDRRHLHGVLVAEFLDQLLAHDVVVVLASGAAT